MKRSIIAVAVLSSLFMSAGAFAKGNQKGELIITGNVVGTTCQFSGETTAKITMKNIGVEQFQGKNKGYIHDDVLKETDVPLEVICTGEKPPKITFSRDQFDVSNNGITINTEQKNGAGFAVYYNSADGQFLQIKGGEPIHVEKNDANKYKLNFMTKYAKAADIVLTGPVRSVLTMTVEAD
ncbi:fimbrial protein YehD [Escherichia coli]|nr:fimbrial protein YehD [Escherichia coli]